MTFLFAIMTPIMTCQIPTIIHIIYSVRFKRAICALLIKTWLPIQEYQRNGLLQNILPKSWQKLIEHLQPHTERPWFSSARARTASSRNFCAQLFPENSAALQRSHLSTRSRRISANATKKSRNLVCQKSPFLPSLSKILVELIWHNTKFYHVI